MTNENNCVLANGCMGAGTAACTKHCTAFIQMRKRRRPAAGLPREYRLVTLQNSPARGGDQAEAYKAAMLTRLHLIVNSISNLVR